MKYVILSLLSVFILSCNKTNETYSLNEQTYKEIVFKDSSFKEVFKKSLGDLEIGLDGANENVIVQFYIDPKENFDTILAIKNCPPISVKDLILVKKYQDHKIYIYSTENLHNRFNKIIDLANDSLTFVNLKPVRGEFECIYTKAFKLDNNKFIFKE